MKMFSVMDRVSVREYNTVYSIKIIISMESRIWKYVSVHSAGKPC